MLVVLGRELRDLLLALAHLDLGLVALLLGVAQLGGLHLLVDGDLLLALLHAQLELLLAVLEREDLVRALAQRVAEALELEAHDVVLDHGLLLLLLLGLEGLLRAVVLELELGDARLEPVLRLQRRMGRFRRRDRDVR